MHAAYARRRTGEVLHPAAGTGRPAQTQRCLALFQGAERREVQLTTSESVIAEVVYMLPSPSLYRLPRTEVARLLRPVLQVRGVKIEHGRSVLRALDLVHHAIRYDLPGLEAFSAHMLGFLEITAPPPGARQRRSRGVV